MLFRKTCTALLLIAATLTSIAAMAADKLTATVDRHEIGKGETIELKVRLNEQVLFDSPDFSVLDADFDVLSSRKQQQYNNINGRTESYTDWNLTLVPKRSGELTIPAISMDGISSTPITITVSDQARPNEFSAENPVFLETTVDKDSAYVQEQLLVTYRFYMAVNLQNLSMTPLEISDAEVVQIGDSQYQKQMDGINFRVVEVRFAIFPQSSGDFTLPAVRFSGYLPSGRNPIFNDLYRNGKRFSLLSDEKTIAVKPQPNDSNSSNDTWLPASGIALHDRWSNTDSDVRAGEPITRTVTITGLGTTAEQLPPVELVESSAYKLYPDQPELDQSASNDGVVGKRTETIAIVPTQAGPLTIPATRIRWWDTKSNNWQTTELAGRTLNVLPAETAAFVPPMPSENALVESVNADEPKSTSIWLIASVATNILLALILIWTIRRRPAKSAEPQPTNNNRRAETEKQQYEAIRQAAKNDDAKVFREALISWAKTYWRDDSIHTSAQVAQRIGDAEFAEQLDALDKALYGNGEITVDLDGLCAAIKRFRANGSAGSGKAESLQPLYPS